MTKEEKEFVKRWISELNEGLLKNFPNDFIIDAETTVQEFPKIQLILGPELFGNYEIVDTNGNLFLNVDSLEKAKYLLYSNRNKPEAVHIPKELDLLKTAVLQYEQHLDNILRGLEKEFKNEFPGSKNFYEISNQIFVSLNLRRF